MIDQNWPRLAFFRAKLHAATRRVFNSPDVSLVEKFTNCSVSPICMAPMVLLEDMMLRVRHYSMMRVRNAHRARGDAVVRGALMLMHEANLVLSRGDRDCDFYDSSLSFI